MVAALVLNAAGPSYAAPGPRRSTIGSATAGRAEDPPAASNQLAPLSNAEVQGYGCLAVGGGMTALAALAGTGELILVLAGGSVLPTGPVEVALAVTGTIFASFCAIGALAAPAVVRMWHEYYDGMEVPAAR